LTNSGKNPKKIIGFFLFFKKKEEKKMGQFWEKYIKITNFPMIFPSEVDQVLCECCD